MKRLIPLFLCVVCLAPAVARAKIYILIEEASGKKFPIAVPQFLTPGGDETSLGREITELVKQDLKIAGIFKVLDESSFVSRDTDVETINFSKWTAIGAYGLVKGLVEKKGSGKILLEMRLFDTQTQQLLTGKQYVVDKKGFAVAVHRFVDEMMRSLTGTPGPFNSEVAAACGKTNQRQISVFGIDGTGRRQITKTKANNISPNWSPDGGTVVFTSFVKYYPEIFSASSGGGSFRQLTRNRATNITPAFSPSGGNIVFASSVSGDTELYLMGRGGGMGSRLTSILNIDVSPAWSPDGSQIVFASERAGNLHLFSMPASGGSAARLTYTGYQNDQPDWSPDGRKIVFTARDRGAFDIFVMNSDGTLIQRLTREEGSNESPTWSPDSRYIAFSSTRGGVYVMLEDGSNQTLIPATGGCINPDWGPRLK